MTKTRIILVWFAIFSINALCTSIIASLTGAKWEYMDTQQRFLICIAVLGNWTGTVGAFLFRVAQKVQAGEPPEQAAIESATDK